MTRERTRKGEMVVGGRRKKVSSSEGDCTRDVDRPRCQKNGKRHKRQKNEPRGSWMACIIHHQRDRYLSRRLSTSCVYINCIFFLHFLWNFFFLARTIDQKMAVRRTCCPPFSILLDSKLYTSTIIKAFLLCLGII